MSAATKDNSFLQNEIGILKGQKEQLKDAKEEAERIEEKIKFLQGNKKIKEVNFEGVLVQGELRCDFAILNPRKKRKLKFPFFEYEPVLTPHIEANNHKKQKKKKKKKKKRSQKQDKHANKNDKKNSTPKTQNQSHEQDNQADKEKILNSESKFEEAQKQYAWLKEQYRKQGKYADEDDAHYWASETARKAMPTFAKKLHLLVAIFLIIFAVALLFVDWEFSLNLIAPAIFLLLIAISLIFQKFGKGLFFNLIFGYGVRIKNIIITIVGVILIFAGLFACADSDGLLQTLPQNSDSANAQNAVSNSLVPAQTKPANLAATNSTATNPPTQSKTARPFGGNPYFTGLYFSVITFATVGYGDLSPSGWAAGCAMLEGLLGVFLNAAFIIVIFRKIIR